MTGMVETVARALCLATMNGTSYPEGWREKRVDQNWRLFSDRRAPPWKRCGYPLTRC